MDLEESGAKWELAGKLSAMLYLTITQRIRNELRLARIEAIVKKKI